jgi:hypothetical protein
MKKELSAATPFWQVYGNQVAAGVKSRGKIGGIAFKMLQVIDRFFLSWNFDGSIVTRFDHYSIVSSKSRSHLCSSPGKRKQGCKTSSTGQSLTPERL